MQDDKFAGGAHLLHDRDNVESTGYIRENLQIGFLVFFLATVSFSIFSQTDVSVSHLFFDEAAGFIFHDSGFASFLRNVFRAIFVLTFLFTCLGMGFLLMVLGKNGAKYAPKWVFVFLCLTIGPGLVANVIIKGNWGRARPVQIEEFNGNKKFTPPLFRANQCEGMNCSFVSGEASSIFAIFFTLAMITSGLLRERLFQLGLVAGFSAGMVRVAQGKHFLSDIIFAGIFMWLTVLLVWWMTFIVWPNRHSILETARAMSLSYYGYISQLAVQLRS